jgi:hypothetical protein
LQNDLKESQVNLDVDTEALKSMVLKLSNLSGLYENLPPSKKLHLVKLILPGGLYLSRSGLQTQKINSLFNHKELDIKEMRVGRIGNMVPISASTPVGTPDGTIYEPIQLIKFLKNVV